MSINILDMIKSQVGSQIAGQIGAKFGVNETVAKSGIDALLPTILGGLISKVSSPGGAAQLDQAIDQGGFDGGLLDNLTNMVTGDQGDQMANQGGGLVSMIFGDKAAALGPIIGKLTGMDSGKVMSLLAMLAPLVMSFLGKQKAVSGLDANGLATMLLSQKDSVAAALPPGVAGAMGLGLMSPSAAAAKTPVPAHASTVANDGGGLGMLKVLVPLVALAAVAYGCYWYIFDGIRPSGPEGNVIVEADPNYVMPTEESEGGSSMSGPAMGGAPSGGSSKPENLPENEADSATEVGSEIEVPPAGDVPTVDAEPADEIKLPAAE